MTRYEIPSPGDHEPIAGPHDVSLRPIAEGDLPDVWRWLSDAEVVEYWGPPPASRDEVEEYIEPDDLSPTWRFVIEWRGRSAGVIQYHHQHPDTDYDWAAGIDIFIGEPGARSHGVGTEAVRMLLRYLFEVKQVHRVTIDPEPRNTRAIHVYERAGFRHEGILRHQYREHGRYIDACWMAMLEDEWPAARERWFAERR